MTKFRTGKSGHDQNTDTQMRREIAERRLRKLQSQGKLTPQYADAIRQVHELRVAQIELEMQNEELNKTRAKYGEALTRYTAAYDFAPIGYLTLRRDGTIVELNRTATKLLGWDASDLLLQPLAVFVAPAFRKTLDDFLATAFQSLGRKDFEMEFIRADGEVLFVLISAVVHESSNLCQAALLDITKRQQASQLRAEAEHRAVELLGQNRQLTQRLFESQEDERRFIAGELHDEFGQLLTAIQAETAAILSLGTQLDSSIATSANAIRDSTLELQKALRRILKHLRPIPLETLGLSDGLRELVHHWNERQRRAHCDLILDGALDGFEQPVNIALYRIVQEALTNVTKHAEATTVTVRLQHGVNGDSAPGSVRLSIRDDGQGAELAALSRGMGLLGMRERVLSMEGTFDVTVKPGHGVVIEVRLPLAKRELGKS